MATQAAAAAPADDPDYIDQIDAGKAAVVSPSGDVRTVAVADLPKGVKEGDYVRGGAIVPVPASEAAGGQIRAKLAAGDTGGPISLDDAAAPAAAAPAPTAPTVQSPLGAIPANTPGLPPPTDDEGTATSGGTGTAPNPEVEKFIDATIAAPPIEGAPPAAAAEPGIPALGPDGLPASSEDIQKRLLASQAAQGKALEDVGAAQATGAQDVAAAQQERDTIRRQQAADLAAQQLYVRDRQQALDAEDAANLQKARDTTIPDFWEGREGSLVGAAIVAALGGAAAGLAGSNHNVALDAITHNIDAYYTRARQTIDDRYKYAEKQGLLNDKMRAQYAGELTDLMQQHAYTLQAAADRVDEVAQAAKGKVDAAQTEYLKAQLGTKSAQELQAARAIDEKNYDSETKRKIAEADLIKANAAMAKVHKGKGGGAGAGAVDYLDAMKAAAQEPGATPTSVMKAAIANGYRGKTKDLATQAKSEIADVEKQTGVVHTQMNDFEKQVNGQGQFLGPAKQLSQIGSMITGLKTAASSNDNGTLKASVTGITEEIGRMLSGGKTTKFTAGLLENLKSVQDDLAEHWDKIKGDPGAGKKFVSNVQKLLKGVADEKRREVDEIRSNAVQQTMGEGGSASSPAAKRAAMQRFRGIFGQVKDENGNPIYEEGGAKGAPAPAGPEWKPIPRGMAGNPALKGKTQVLVGPDGSITDAR